MYYPVSLRKRTVALILLAGFNSTPAASQVSLKPNLVNNIWDCEGVGGAGTSFFFHRNGSVFVFDPTFEPSERIRVLRKDVLWRQREVVFHGKDLSGEGFEVRLFVSEDDPPRLLADAHGGITEGRPVKSAPCELSNFPYEKEYRR